MKCGFVDGCMRCSSYLHTSIAFKKKVETRNAGNTKDEERTYVRTKEQNRHVIADNTEANTRVWR